MGELGVRHRDYLIYNFSLQKMKIIKNYYAVE